MKEEPGIIKKLLTTASRVALCLLIVWKLFGHSYSKYLLDTVVSVALVDLILFVVDKFEKHVWEKKDK